MAMKHSKQAVAVLELLSDLQPMDFDDICLQAARRGLRICADEISLALAQLGNDDYLVERIPEAGQLDKFSITVRGRAMLIAAAARNVFGADAEAPVQVSCCDPREPVKAPAAVICLDEDELDAWWAGLDVELKADAFVGFSLRAQGQDDSHIAADDTEVRVPVVGTIGGEKSAERSAEEIANAAALLETDHYFKPGAAQ